MEQASHQHPDGGTCEHCLVDPKRSKSSLAAWIIAALAVVFALFVFFSRAGSAGSTFGGLGAFALVGILACPLTMGAMMWFMMRKGH